MMVNNIEISQENIQLLVEALMYATCKDIAAEWSDAQIQQLLQLSLLFKSQINTLDNINLLLLKKEFKDNTSLFFIENFKKNIKVKYIN